MAILLAVLSAFFAGLTAFLAKIGVKKTDSDLATAIRTTVVLFFAWLMVAIVGSGSTIGGITPKAWIFLILSGASTGLCWIFYFKALSMANLNKVAPVDKSGVILTVLISIVVFGETSHLLVRLFSIAVIGIGTYLMLEKKDVSPSKEKRKGWLLFALISVVFGALTSVFAKLGLDGVESNLGTAIRTLAILPIAWGIVFFQKKHTQLSSIDRKELLWICLSGVATGASWLCYFSAVQIGDLSVVVPIDKMSILVTIAFSALILKEPLKKKNLLGLSFMTLGTLTMAIFA